MMWPRRPEAEALATGLERLPQGGCTQEGQGGTGDEEEGEWEGWSPLFCF